MHVIIPMVRSKAAEELAQTSAFVCPLSWHLIVDKGVKYQKIL